MPEVGSQASECQPEQTPFALYLPYSRTTCELPCTEFKASFFTWSSFHVNNLCSTCSYNFLRHRRCGLPKGADLAAAHDALTALTCS